MKIYKAVLEDGQEWYFEISGNDRYAVDNVASIAVEKGGMKTHHSDPKKTKVQIFEIRSENFKIVPKLIRTIDVNVPHLPMTSDEYQKELHTILVELPNAIGVVVAKWVNDRDACYEACLAFAREMVDDLAPAIQQLLKGCI